MEFSVTPLITNVCRDGPILPVHEPRCDAHISGPNSPDRVSEDQGTSGMDSSSMRNRRLPADKLVPVDATDASEVNRVAEESQPSTTYDPNLLKRTFTKISRRAFSSSSAAKELSEKDEAYAKVKFESDEKFTEGIPHLAIFIDSNESFCMHRRFGVAAETILIRKQIEIVKAWDGWKELNASYAENDKLSNDLNKATEDLEMKLTSYYNFYFLHRRMRGESRVSDANYQSQRYWVVDNLLKVEEEAEEYLLFKQDLVQPSGGNNNNKQKSKIEGWIEALLAWPYTWKWLAKLFQEKKNKRFGREGYVYHGSGIWRATIAKFLIAVVIAILMLTPSLVILLVDMTSKIRAVVVAIFILVCVVPLGVIIDVNERDMFLCFAAYGAILLAVLGNTVD